MASYKPAERYLRAVKKHLICSKENRARLMELTSRAVDACLEDDPDKPYSALVCGVGEPKAFAESLLTGIPGDEVESSRKKRRFRFYAAIVSAAVVMVTAFTALTGFYLKYQETLNGGFIAKNDTIIVCPEDMTTEEFKEFLNQTTGSNWGKDKK